MMMVPSVVLGLYALAVSKPQDVAHYRISEVVSQSAYAGRLGSRVSSTLVLEREGRTVRLRLSPYHTRLARREPEWVEGQWVEVSRTAISAGRAGLGDIRAVGHN